MTIVHNANTLSQWDNMGQIKILKFRDEDVFDFLNFIIKKLNLVCAIFIKVLVKFGHGCSFKGAFSVPIFKEAKNTTGVDNLV